MIEKHFTLDRTLPGPDHRASLEPGELKAMVDGVRAATAALGSPERDRLPRSSPTLRSRGAAFVAARPIKKAKFSKQT